MARKPKRKLTAAERRQKKVWRATHERVFLNGKQKWLRRPASIDGMNADEFFLLNAGPIALHQQGMWEVLDENIPADPASHAGATPAVADGGPDPRAWRDGIPFGGLRETEPPPWNRRS